MTTDLSKVLDAIDVPIIESYWRATAFPEGLAQRAGIDPRARYDAHYDTYDQYIETKFPPDLPASYRVAVLAHEYAHHQQLKAGRWPSQAEITLDPTVLYEFERDASYLAVEWLRALGVRVTARHRAVFNMSIMSYASKGITPARLEGDLL